LKVIIDRFEGEVNSKLWFDGKLIDGKREQFVDILEKMGKSNEEDIEYSEIAAHYWNSK
jgi:hypothetical protein